MKRVSSVVWQFFDRLEEDKRCVAVLCKLCDTEYKYFGNTTNLRVHLIKKHPIQWQFRQNNWDGTKVLDDSKLSGLDEDDNSQPSPKVVKRRKYRGDSQNVRYSLSVKNPTSGTSEDLMPRIEIERVNVNDVEEDKVSEDQQATENLVRRMHAQASDEEWLEDDYQQIEMIEPSRKRVYAKIKREVVSPPRQQSNYRVVSSNLLNRSASASENVHKDEYSVFGEYIANKLRKFKTPRTQGNIQQLITTILWQAEYGMYDNADAVKRVLLCNVNQSQASEIDVLGAQLENQISTEKIGEDSI